MAAGTDNLYQILRLSRVWTAAKSRIFRAEWSDWNASLSKGFQTCHITRVFLEDLEQGQHIRVTTAERDGKNVVVRVAATTKETVRE